MILRSREQQLESLSAQFSFCYYLGLEFYLAFDSGSKEADPGLIYEIHWLKKILRSLEMGTLTQLLRPATHT